MKRLRANNGDITDLKKQAMDELSAIGVTFPVHCSYYILAGSTTALDSATVLKQCFTDSFGDDFIVLDIETFVSSTMKEVVAPKLQSFVHMGWGADFGDPINFLTQIIVHDDNAYYSCNMTNIEGIAENGAADYQKDLAKPHLCCILYTKANNLLSPKNKWHTMPIQNPERNGPSKPEEP